MRLLRSEKAGLLVLALLPLLAYAPALTSGHLLGPGDGATLHLPLRAAVWDAYRHGEMPFWNGGIFSGTPLLASYRPGALYPPMLLLAWLPPFWAFQVLVVASLQGAALLAYFYARRVGARAVGAYLSALSFSLGPYLVGHLEDTATIIAAPLLPLLLFNLEGVITHNSTARRAALALSVALLILAGSPEAAGAGLIFFLGRMAILAFSRQGHPDWRSVTGPFLLGCALAAPQLLPSLWAWSEAGAQSIGLSSTHTALWPGASGLILRYVSHTPAPALALATLILLPHQRALRSFALVVALCLLLQWGQGPLNAPGALALAFDFSLALMSGLTLSTLIAERDTGLGRRLRLLFLAGALTSAACLPLATAVIGPFGQRLSGCVGILAFALIVFFRYAQTAETVRSLLWLLPLSVSFVLQPHGRAVWDTAPTHAQLLTPSVARQMLEKAMGARRTDRVLTLARAWPQDEQFDLAYANFGLLMGRQSANGYDPMAALRARAAFDAMGTGGTLPAKGFFKTAPERLETLGVRWVQVPQSALVATADHAGLGEPLDLILAAGQTRDLPTPMVPATEIRLATSLSDAVTLAQGQDVARVVVRLASGRQLVLYLRAGIETAEWAWERADVRAAIQHERATILESWSGLGGGFTGHRYLARLQLPGRYLIDGVRIERLSESGVLHVARIGLFDALSNRATALSQVAGFVSDTDHFRKTLSLPSVRLYELPFTRGPAHVVAGLRAVPNDGTVLRGLRAPRALDLDLRREALIVASDWQAAKPAPPATPSNQMRVEMIDRARNRIRLRAQGPGYLVVTEGWDRGWTAAVDGRAAAVLRVNHVQMAIAIEDGNHIVTLRYRPRGFVWGVALAVLAALAAIVWGRPLF